MNEYAPKRLIEVLEKYLIKHSSRRINYLYWNLINSKERTLLFVNLVGKELHRLNNSELTFRLIKVNNIEEWNILSSFLNELFINLIETKNKGVHVIRVDFLLSYLKSIIFIRNIYITVLIIIR